MVMSGALENAEITVVVGDNAGMDIDKTRVTIDDAPLENTKGSATGTIGTSSVLPGPHRLNVGLEVRGTNAVFTYVSSRAFEIQGEQGFFVQAGRSYRVMIHIDKSSDLTLKYNDRFSVRVEVAENTAGAKSAAK